MVYYQISVQFFLNSNQKVIYLVFRDRMSNESIFMNRFNDSIYLVNVIML